jgi:hypothetical protein
MSVYIKENGAWVEVSGGSGANSLNELSDVSISNPQTNEVLKYDGTNWVNDTDATGSGSGTVTTVTVEQENRASTCNDPITVSTPSTGVQQIDIGDDSNAHGTKFVGTTEPVSSCDGDIWYDTTEGGDIFLLDDDKLVFGTNPSTPGNTNHQLEIYSSPTTGTGGSQVIKSASTDRAIRIQTNGTFIVEGANGNIADVRLETTADGVDIGGTGSIKVPVGTTAQRNSSPTAGDFRYNSDLGQFEGYTTAWGGIGGGGTSLNVITKSSAYTLQASDVGSIISISSGGVTVPSGVFSAGDTVIIYNDSASSQTITQGSGVTLRLPGTSDTGDRTLQLRGLSTILCVASDEFAITGTGLL